MAGKKGRSGRPRAGGPKQTAVFSTRLKPEIRKALGAIAKRNKRSLSQQIEAWVAAEVRGKPEQTKKAFAGDTRNRALLAIIAEAMRWFAQGFRNEQSKAGDKWWMDDPFSFGAFRICIESLLDGIKPTGELVPHPHSHELFGLVLGATLDEQMKTPEKLMAIYGSIVSVMLLFDLREGKPRDVSEAPSEVWDAILPKIRQDLNLHGKSLGLVELDKLKESDK